MPVALLLALATAAQAANGESILVSRQSAALGGAAGDDFSIFPSISDDGRIVAFQSAADNLSTEDNNAYENVFVRDTLTDTTTLASRQSAGTGGAAADADASIPALSSDGRFVAFSSNADNLSTEDNNAYLNVFVRDTLTETTTLASRQSLTAGGTGADGDSTEPSISDDGRFVAITSEGDNLSTEDNDALRNVFVRDTVSNTILLVSRQSATAGGAGADNSSYGPSISGDGRFVAFYSDADNLSTEDDNAYRNVFVRDTLTNTTTLASRQSAAGAGADADSYTPSISSDGRFVGFSSDADNLSGDDNNAYRNIFVHDTLTNATELVSRQGAGGAGGDGRSFGPSVSHDGRYVAFSSEAGNLSGEDNDATEDVFVYDTLTDTLTLASRESPGAGGAGAGDYSTDPSISADGRLVAFESSTDNLSTEDNNAFTNIFVRDLLAQATAPLPPPAPGPTGGSGEPATTGQTATKLSLKLTLRRVQRLGRRGVLVVGVKCNKACVATVSGSLNVARASRVYSLKRVSRSLSAGKRRTFRVRLAKKSLRAARRALRRGRRVSAKLRVETRDAEGGVVRKSSKVKLKR